MTLSNEQRAARCRKAIATYSDDDAYTNLVDFLADAMHLCNQHGRSFHDAAETALMHFDAETAGDEILQDVASQPISERTEP